MKRTIGSLFIVLLLCGVVWYAIWQGYNLGQDRGPYHLELKAFQAIVVGEPYDKANTILKDADFHMMDYLTPNDNGSYDSHWLYKNDASNPTQTWISLTVEGIGKDKLVKKTMEIRQTPSR